MTIKALLLNCDGTVFDSDIIYHQLWHSVLDDLGLQLDFADYARHLLGMSIPRQVATIVRQFALAINPQVLTSIYNHRLKLHLQQQSIPLVEGVLQTLHFFRHHNITLALVSNSDKATVLSGLYWHRLADYFAVIVTGQDTPHSKPAPEGYQLALTALGLQSRECLAIEDSANGIKAAQAAGICCAGLNRRYSYDHASDIDINTDINKSIDTGMANADWIVSKHSDIRQHLLQQLAA